MTRNLKWILLIGALVAAVMMGGWFAWVEVASHRECVELGAAERALLMFPLAGQVNGYKRKHNRLPETGEEAVRLLRESAMERLEQAAFYKQGRLIWMVKDNKPYPLRDGRQLVCWFMNPKYSFYAAAVVMEENGALSAELLPQDMLP